MSANPEPTGDADLFQQARWVQGLAFAILRDRQLAEDVSQEVLLKALNGEPRQGRVLKAWLAAVTKNLAFNARRDRLRRSAREERAARPETTPPAKTSLEVLEAHRALTAAIAALAPDQREVVVMRFFENLDFAAIAERSGINEPAARMRLHRALVSLRGELTTHDRDWRTLCTLALPASLVSSIQDPVPMGRILLLSATTARLTTLAALLVLVLAGAMMWTRWSDGQEGVSLPEAAELNLPESSIPPTSLSRSEATLDSVGLETRLDLGATIPPEYQPHPEVRSGRIYYQGLPVAGVKVEVRQNAQLFTTESDAEGIFRLEVDRYARVWIEATKGDLKGYGGQGWPEQIELSRSKIDPRPLTIRDARTGLGISGAQVDIVQLLYRHDQSGLPLDTHGKNVGVYIADREGRIAIDPELRVSHLNFSVVAEGYLTHWGDASEHDGSLEIELVPGSDPELILLAADGQPLIGAQVYVGAPGARKVLTDGDGRVPGPIGWRMQQTRLRFPWMVVQLPSGRHWFLEGHESSESFATISPTRVEVRIEDSPVAARLAGSPLAAGCWVEAARVDGFFETALLGLGNRDPGQIGTPMFLGSPWQRLEPGEWVNLERGWTGPNIRVIARMQPAGLILGQFPIEAGRASVLVPPLARLRMIIDGLPDYGVGGWQLWLRDGSGWSGDSRPYTVHPADSLNGTFDRWITPGNYTIELFHSRWPVRYYWDHGAMRAGVPVDRSAITMSLNAGETLLQGMAEAGVWQKVRILVDGHPVHGGNLSAAQIDPDGWTFQPVNSQGEVTLRWGGSLKVPPEVGTAVDRPVHFTRTLPPISVMKLSPGEPPALDFKLSSIFLDAHGIDLSKTYTLTVRPFPYDVNTSGNMEQAQFVFADARYPFSLYGNGAVPIDSRSITWEFRVPAGTYSVALFDQASRTLIWLTPQTGQAFLAGTQTVLSKQD